MASGSDRSRTKSENQCCCSQNVFGARYIRSRCRLSLLTVRVWQTQRLDWWSGRTNERRTSVPEAKKTSQHDQANGEQRKVFCLHGGVLVPGMMNLVLSGKCNHNFLVRRLENEITVS